MTLLDLEWELNKLRSELDKSDNPANMIVLIRKAVADYEAETGDTSLKSCFDKYITAKDAEQLVEEAISRGGMERLLRITSGVKFVGAYYFLGSDGALATVDKGYVHDLIVSLLKAVEFKQNPIYVWKAKVTRTYTYDFTVRAKTYSEACEQANEIEKALLTDDMKANASYASVLADSVVKA